jgi:hypothetical protein
LCPDRVKSLIEDKPSTIKGLSILIAIMSHLGGSLSGKARLVPNLSTANLQALYGKMTALIRPVLLLLMLSRPTH